MAKLGDDHPESDLMRQAKDALGDGRRQPTKELGIPDHREDAQEHRLIRQKCGR